MMVEGSAVDDCQPLAQPYHLRLELDINREMQNGPIWMLIAGTLGRADLVFYNLYDLEITAVTRI